MAKYRVKCPPGKLCISGLTIGITVISLFFVCALFMRPQIIMTHTPPQITQIQTSESRYDMAPEPLRQINIPTQGIPDSFQSAGIINMDDKILPLYGRRIRGDRWNYYTRTDTYNPVPIPIHFQKRDCMDDIGCQEILSGDEIKVDAMNKFGRVKIYKYNGPKYIP